MIFVLYKDYVHFRLLYLVYLELFCLVLILSCSLFSVDSYLFCSLLQVRFCYVQEIRSYFYGRQTDI